MASPAYRKFVDGVANADQLASLIGNHRLRPQDRTEAQFYTHAALVGYTAAWNAYLPELVRAFYADTAQPLVAAFHSIHSVAKARAEIEISKFNTPNYENSRNLLICCTGYDPINHWTWPAEGLSAPLVQNRLNEILKIRHSFAHGFTLPIYTWAASPGGHVKLTRGALRMVRNFLRHVTLQTEAGIKQHMITVHNVGHNW